MCACVHVYVCVCVCVCACRATALLNLFPVVYRVLGDGATATATPKTIYRPDLHTAVAIGSHDTRHPPPRDMAPSTSRFRLVIDTLVPPTVNNVSTSPAAGGHPPTKPALTPSQIAALAGLVRPSPAARPGW